MEFYQNGTGTDWVMDQYFGLADLMGGFLLQVSICAMSIWVI
jgi:hypothetical protein